jgi:hypothetical protein
MLSTAMKTKRVGHSPQGLRRTKMDKAQNGEGTLFGNVTDLGKQFLSMNGAKKLAAWYIDNSEKMSNGVLDYQASATEWAKGTRLGSIFEAQFDFSRKFVKRSAEIARKIWQVDSR